MNENYLNQLLSAGAPGANSAVGNYFASSGMTMNYPIWTSTDGDPVSAFDGILIANRKEIFFIKKEIPKFKFPKEPMTISFDNVSDEDMEYFRDRLLSSLKLPSWLLNSSYGIISNDKDWGTNPCCEIGLPQIFDEFH